MKGAIVYISSNRESEAFEKRIVADMRAKKGNLPVYSVTQKPMDFEFNMCVGDVGTSGFNFCRQLQLAVATSTADYVISCEADCLYSPDYFTFVPPRLDCVYRNTNNYVLPLGKDFWYEKESQTAFQIAGRNVLLDRLNFLLKDQPMWDTTKKNFPKEIGQPFLPGWKTFKTKYACFGIKTGDGMRNHTRSGKEEFYELPYWGTALQVRDTFGI